MYDFIHWEVMVKKYKNSRKSGSELIVVRGTRPQINAGFAHRSVTHSASTRRSPCTPSVRMRLWGGERRRRAAGTLCPHCRTLTGRWSCSLGTGMRTSTGWRCSWPLGGSDFFCIKIKKFKLTF